MVSILRWVSVKRASLTVLLVLLGAVICAGAIPPTDAFEAACNDVDTPVNQSPPVVPGIRLVRPVANPVHVPAALRWDGREPNSPAGEPASETIASHHSPVSRQDLLCVLII